MSVVERNIIKKTDRAIEAQEVSALEKITNYIPHPVALVFLVNILAIFMALTLTEKSMEEILKFWGQGFVNNFGFGMQFVLLLVLGYGLAITPLFQKMLSKFANLVSTQTQAVILIAIVSMTLAWFNWGLGIVGGVFLANYIARTKVDYNYPLLITAGISGLLMWENGISGSAILHVTQGKHLLAEQIGAITLQQTVFSSLNLAVTFLLIVAIPLVLCLVQKPKCNHYVIDEPLQQPVKNNLGDNNFAVKLENSWILSLAFGSLAVLYVVRYLSSSPMNMPTYLFMLIALGIVLRKVPMSYQQDIIKSVQVCWVFYVPIVFYGAVQGVVDLSGLNTVIAGWFTSVGNSTLFPAVTFLSSAFINLLVPNAGSQWLIEGSSLTTAAANLGVSNATTLLAFSYGAGWAKLLQISLFAPLLGIGNVRISDMARYLGAVILTSMIILIFAVTIMPV
ncbi:TIGR00366 family protein [Desulforamulus aquiferis]|uniref:TIGR00366 family protein n=1 Tax=Desulforamulus aquiferis TaxID=1397668 RepID=A0AAW7ZA28_9FIRM|nr:TIGR00366 family protein [Desulforamulus aquiferis]MDO7785700.1 TIGR00366 family protein [Desulforamulus aquiferis]